MPQRPSLSDRTMTKSKTLHFRWVQPEIAQYVGVNHSGTAHFQPFTFELAKTSRDGSVNGKKACRNSMTTSSPSILYKNGSALLSYRRWKYFLPPSRHLSDKNCISWVASVASFLKTFPIETKAQGILPSFPACSMARAVHW